MMCIQVKSDEVQRTITRTARKKRHDDDTKALLAGERKSCSFALSIKST